MSGNRLAKVFDLECAFETGSEKAAEGGDEGGEGCEDEDVELHRGDVDGGGDVEGEGEGDFGEEGGDVVGVGDEDGVGRAVEACEDVCAEVLRCCKFSGYSIGRSWRDVRLQDI